MITATAPECVNEIFFGSISPSGHRLLSLLSRRTDAHVPFALMPAVTWAAPRVAPFAWMACGLAIRRGSVCCPLPGVCVVFIYLMNEAEGVWEPTVTGGPPPAAAL